MVALNQTSALWTERLPKLGDLSTASESAEIEGPGPACCWFYCNLCCWVMC